VWPHGEKSKGQLSKVDSVNGMSWDPHTLLKPPYAPVISAEVAFSEALTPSSCPAFRNG